MAIKLQTNLKLLLGIIIVAAAAAFALTRGKAEAACPAVDTSRGTVTSTFNAPSSGTYYVWARMQASSATNDSFTMEIDGTTCGITVGDTSVPTSGWKWVGYKSGNTGTRNTVSLAAGTHTMTIIGREDGVKVDRILFLTNANCTPDDATKGDNCVTNNDGTPPTVSISSPANNATISGTTTAIQANASDNIGVTKVEFYMGSTLLGTDTASPYSFALNTTLYPNGAYALYATAYDANDNKTSSTQINVNISNTPADTTGPTVTISSPLEGATVSGNTNIAATVSDPSGVSKVEYLVDGAVKSTAATSPYSYSFDTKTVTNGAHTMGIRATDNANNVTTKNVNVTVNNTTTTPKKADFNNDGRVSAADLAALLANYGQTVTASTNGDVNGDGRVTISDLAELLALYTG